MKNLYISVILMLINCYELKAMNPLEPTKNIKISVRQSDPNVLIEPVVCGKLCDSAKIDAISTLGPESEPNNYILIIRSACSWKLDIKNPSIVSPYGHRHQFTFNTVEATFTIFESKTALNLTAIYTSGMSADIFKYDGKTSKKIWTGADPLPGLIQDYIKPIDAVFEWHETKTIYLIQGSNYYVYDMINMKNVSGPRHFNEDFGINPTAIGGIDAAFTLGNKIYIFTLEDFYIYSVKSQNPANGKLTGSIGTKLSIKSEFFKCSSTVTSTALSPLPAKDTAPVEVVTNSDSLQILSSIKLILFTLISNSLLIRLRLC